MVKDRVRNKEQDEAWAKEFDQEIRELRHAKVESYPVQIWIGLKEGYDGPVRDIADVDLICQDYVDKVGLCVTVTETMYFYTNGYEPGVCVGLINYPRFPTQPWQIRKHAFDLAYALLVTLKQYRCTIVTPEFTYLLENPNGPSKNTPSD